jgi:hypothetical protein
MSSLLVGEIIFLLKKLAHIWIERVNTCISESIDKHQEYKRSWELFEKVNA